MNSPDMFAYERGRKDERAAIREEIETLKRVALVDNISSAALEMIDAILGLLRIRDPMTARVTESAHHQTAALEEALEKAAETIPDELWAKAAEVVQLYRSIRKKDH